MEFQKNILLVDDEKEVLETWSDLLKESIENCQVSKAINREEALSMLEKGTPYSVALVDLRMPDEKDGLAVISDIHGLSPFTTIFAFSAYLNPLNIDESFKNGAFAVIDKGWQYQEKITINLVQSGIALYNLHKSHLYELSEVLTNVCDTDFYFIEHNERVSEYAVMIGEKLLSGSGGKWKDVNIEELRIGGRLHDIGKAFIPKEILGKPGKLSDEEYMLVKTHVKKGAELIKKESTTLQNIRLAIEEHHLWYAPSDRGVGYPVEKGQQARKGNEISQMGRILAVADALDAMTSNRFFDKDRPLEEVIEVLLDFSKDQFDPEIIKIFGEKEFVERVRTFRDAEAKKRDEAKKRKEMK
ncbi:MAG: response regulator [Nitrospinae bacterium]|nr:response regulator [Nitrospinota bacterium]